MTTRWTWGQRPGECPSRSCRSSAIDHRAVFEFLRGGSYQFAHAESIRLILHMVCLVAADNFQVYAKGQAFGVQSLCTARKMDAFIRF